MAPTSCPQRPRREPLFDVHPQTGVSFEIFYADPSLETFGRHGAGWFYWSRLRGRAPDGSPIGPFATSYAAYSHAMGGSSDPTCDFARSVRSGKDAFKRF